MIRGTSTGQIGYLCDKCLTPCQKALKPTPIGNEEVWEICEKCRKKRDEREKSITSDNIERSNEADKSI